MRVTLSDPSLLRQAGRFVWLELNYDDEGNQAFLARHGVTWTPAILVLDPSDERVTASHMGGMSLSELKGFLGEGEHRFRSTENGKIAAALSRGNAAAGAGRYGCVSGGREAGQTPIT